MYARALRTDKIRRLLQDVLCMGGFLVDPYSPHQRPLSVRALRGLFLCYSTGLRLLLKLIDKLAANLSLDAAEQAPVTGFKTHTPGHDGGVDSELVSQGYRGFHRG